jgi:hypothetical protein
MSRAATAPARLTGAQARFLALFQGLGVRLDGWLVAQGSPLARGEGVGCQDRARAKTRQNKRPCPVWQRRAEPGLQEAQDMLLVLHQLLDLSKVGPHAHVAGLVRQVRAEAAPGLPPGGA